MIKKNKCNLKFMDFCSGIGAGRVGLEKLGLTCVGFSEIDKNSERTYREFFGNNENNYGDLMKINPKELPDFDLMIAGFPCQPFSIVGQRKGITDHRGQIIYGLIKIMKTKDVPYFILENVKGLINHDKGRTFKIILKELYDAGYCVFYKVLNSLELGVPQMRERIYLIGISRNFSINEQCFKWPKVNNSRIKLKDCLSDNDPQLQFDEEDKSYETFIRYLENKYNKGFFNLKELLEENYLVLDTRQSDLRLYRDKVPTLRTGRHGILYVRNGKLRRLSGFESLLLQGFPKILANKVKGKVNESLLLSQAGNAMTVNAIEEIGKSLLILIGNEYEQDGAQVARFANCQARI